MPGSATLVTDGLHFPECPRWHEGEIWFVDTPHIKVVDSSEKVRIHGTLPARLVLGLAFTADGTVLAGDSVERKIYGIDPAGSVEVYADLSMHFPFNTNEIALGPDGSLYVGSMGFDILHGAAPTPSHIAHVTPDGAVSPVGREVLFPNGLLVTPEGTELYVAESFASKITAFEILPDGTLADASTFADLTGRDVHHPDGLTLDGKGGLWYADPIGGAIVNVAPGGEELGRVTVPRVHPTSCWLGGDNGDFLIVTATDQMANPELEFAGAGALFTVSLGG